MKLKTITVPERIQGRISNEIPEYVIQKRDAGRGQTLDYISGSTVIDMLNTTFGIFGWEFEVLQQYVQQSIPYFDTYAKVPDKDKVKNPANGKMGLWVDQAPVAWVKGRLTVKLEDENGQIHKIVKEAFGSKSIIGKQSEQEHIFKSAQTDALKKAASLLGIGAQLYRTNDEGKGIYEQAFFEILNKPVIWTEKKIKDSKVWSQLLEIAIDYGLTVNELNQYASVVTEGSYNDIYTLPEVYFDTLFETITDEAEESEE